MIRKKLNPQASAPSPIVAAAQSGELRYELQEGGRRLRAVEQIRGAGRDQDNLWVFERL
jgi:hypothetical protein